MFIFDNIYQEKRIYHASKLRALAHNRIYFCLKRLIVFINDKNNENCIDARTKPLYNLLVPEKQGGRLAVPVQEIKTHPELHGLLRAKRRILL